MISFFADDHNSRLLFLSVSPERATQSWPHACQEDYLCPFFHAEKNEKNSKRQDCTAPSRGVRCFPQAGGKASKAGCDSLWAEACTRAVLALLHVASGSSSCPKEGVKQKQI